MKKGVSLIVKGVIFLGLGAVFLLIFFSFATNFMGSLPSNAHFSVTCNFKVYMNLFRSKLPGTSSSLQGEVRVYSSGWKEFSIANSTADFLFKRASNSWGCLNKKYPLFEGKKDKTLQTFTDYIKLEREIKASDIMDRIDSKYENRTEEMKTGLIKGTDSGMARLIKPGEKLPKEFVTKVIFSEWNVKKKGKGWECPSEEVEGCYITPKARKESIPERYQEKSHFDILTDEQNWEDFREGVRWFVENKFCNIRSLDELREGYQNMLALITLNWEDISIFESLATFVKGDFPCPYYRTPCGYLNKSMVCCENKIFICIQEGAKPK